MSNRVGGALWWTLATRAPLFARFLHQELHVSASAADLVVRNIRHMSTLESGRRNIGGAVRSARDEYHRTLWARPFQCSSKAYSSEATPSSINPLQQMPSPKPSSNQTQAPANNMARAILRGVAISPRKLNDFVRILPGLHMEDALIQCRIHHKKSARICERVLLSARANATTNHGLDAARLCVSQAWVGKGQYLKRVSIHGRGRSGVLHKKRSHLTIILKEADEPVPRRTRVIPMMQERKKMWNIREGKKFDKPAPWSWWPKRRTGFENGFGSTRRESKTRDNQIA